jgi:hypothetical protein
VLRPLGRLVDAAPVELREKQWAVSGWLEAVTPEQLGDLDGEEVSRWFVDRYPQRQYPALMIGSANGALTHLAAALGIPWLPQNFLVPVRHGGRARADDPRAAMEWAREPARTVLDNNPGLALHQMHDPNQDRPMLNHMAFFRLKRQTLGAAYGEFIRSTLEPGGTIFIVDCARRWPATKVQSRHVFQFGGMGAVTPDEYHHGSERIAEFLERYGSGIRAWDPPEPDGDYPEGEWGFDQKLAEDVELFARGAGYHVRRITFEEPEDVSPLIADLHRWWYAQMGHAADRLLVETFLLMEPYWTLRTRSVPLWLKFTTDISADRLERYLDEALPFNHIDLMLFQHGVRSAGLVPVERWRRLISHARRSARFVALRPERHPSSISTYIRYLDSLKRIPERHPLPAPLRLAEVDSFLATAATGHPVRWLDGAALPDDVPAGNV